MISEYEMRATLRRWLACSGEVQADQKIIEELSLANGRARVDLALVGHDLSGFEIKSDRDTLRRLPTQVEVYASVLSHISAVVTPRHVSAALNIVPPWWGVLVMHRDRGTLTVEVGRRPKRNPNPDPIRIASLLWRNELLSILEDMGLDWGYRQKPRRILCSRLAESLRLRLLESLVATTLSQRENWRGECNLAAHDA